MNIYLKKNKHSNKNRDLVVLLTTTQSPHIEANFNYIERNLNIFKRIFILDLVSDTEYRNEYTWRDYLPIRQNIIRKIQNGFIKNLYIKQKIKEHNFLRNEINISGNNIFSSKEIFSILKTYSMTEFRSAAISSSKYTGKIISSINYVSIALNAFLKKYKLNNIDQFLLFNGRHPLEYSCRLLLFKLNFKNIIYHECNNYMYKIYYTDFQIHNLKKYYSFIKKYKLANKNLSDKWVLQKKINFRKNYKKKYISFFTSSFDEYSFAYNRPINQPALIHKLIENNSAIPLKIRVHPNTNNKSNSDQNYWNFLKEKYPEIIINYNDDKCSYDLIQESFFTISIGSSIAPESLILNTNHLLCGNQHMYDNLPGYYKSNENSFIKTILNMYSKRNELKLIKPNEREYAAASLLFNKEIGEEIKLAPFGKYPFKAGSNKF